MPLTSEEKKRIAKLLSSNPSFKSKFLAKASLLTEDDAENLELLDTREEVLEYLRIQFPSDFSSSDGVPSSSSYSPSHSSPSSVTLLITSTEDLGNLREERFPLTTKLSKLKEKVMDLYSSKSKSLYFPIVFCDESILLGD